VKTRRLVRAASGGSAVASAAASAPQAPGVTGAVQV